MSKKTLYSHFDTKLQLLDAVIENKFRRVREDFDRILAARPDFPEMLREFLDCVQRHTSAIQPPYLRDMRLEGPEVFQKIERLRSASIEHYFGQLMRLGRETGFVRNDVPARVIVEILLAAVQAIIHPARLEEWGLTPRSACGLITQIVLEGAIAPASRSRLKSPSSP
jgi:AcrR family transcriptional regulator